MKLRPTSAADAIAQTATVSHRPEQCHCRDRCPSKLIPVRRTSLKCRSTSAAHMFAPTATEPPTNSVAATIAPSRPYFPSAHHPGSTTTNLSNAVRAQRITYHPSQDRRSSLTATYITESDRSSSDRGPSSNHADDIPFVTSVTVVMHSLFSESHNQLRSSISQPKIWIKS